jgi:hypothetical protein
MKKFLAVFLGSPEAMEAWQHLPDVERKQREKDGLEAWHKWASDHAASIADMGSPLGKTKRIDRGGIKDVRNELGAWTVITADTQENAARLFLNHPHFTIFPGDRVEVMECLPIPDRPR